MQRIPLLDRLLLWQKFALLALIALVLTGIPTALYLNEMSKTIHVATLERSGLAPSASVLRVIQMMQQHRGLSAVVLNDPSQPGDKREAKQRDVDAAIAAAAVMVKKIDDKKIIEQWGKAVKDWESLRNDIAAKNSNGPQSFAIHTNVLSQLMIFNENVADYYGLSLDPDGETYQLIQAVYFHMPSLTEETGKLRGRAAGLLAIKQGTMLDKFAVSSQIGRVGDRLGWTQAAFDKAGTIDPSIIAKLTAGMADAAKQTRELMVLARDKVVNTDAMEFPPGEFIDIATRAIDAQYGLTTAASKVIGERLEAKVQAAWMHITYVLCALGGIMLLAGFAARLITRSITVPMEKSIELAQKVAGGDLTAEIEVKGTNETARLLRSLKDMSDALVNIVAQVRTGTDIIATASTEIASGNQDLSSRTEAQAGSLEETASSMEELTSTVRQNGDNARQANQLATSASEVAQRGGSVVSQVVGTMEEINSSSRKIVDIISVIDGIAFQTNILALNAAVEAARAGEQGRGFAVVASEVRNLAQRSAAAAKEIKSLIGDSVEKVETGTRLVSEAGATMQEIVTSVQHVSDIISEISSASQEQIAGIEQVNQAITEMDNATQHNAALVEQAAAAAESLQEQARNQADVVSVFKLAPGAGAAAVAPAARPAARPAPRAAAPVRKAAPSREVAVARPAAKRLARPAPAKAETDEWETF